MSRTILKARSFRLYRKTGRLFLRCLTPNAYPRTVRLADRHEAQLRACGRDWVGAAILEFGCGFYAEPVRRNLYP